jgi:hypothetical protein
LQPHFWPRLLQDKRLRRNSKAELAELADPGHAEVRVPDEAGKAAARAHQVPQHLPDAAAGRVQRQHRFLPA